jgi:Xaa-Pro aminopeptidase
VLIDVGVKLDGYWADISQMIFLGEPTAEYRRAYEVVEAAHKAAVAAATVGSTPEAVDAAAARVLMSAGYDRESRTGHGIGMDIHEPPSVMQGEVSQLRAGMAITVEPGVYLKDRFGLRFEDSILITNRGPQATTEGARPLFHKDGA